MQLKLVRFIERYWILLLFVIIKLILQFVFVNPVYELHRDEFLHLDQANHLAFGYISVPPFTAVISKIIFFLGGDIFWIRFFPALFGALTIGALIAFTSFKPFKQFRFVGLSFVIIIALFAFLKAKDYYSLGLYPVLFAFGSVYFEKILADKWKLIIMPLLISINLCVFIMIARLVLPVLTPSEINQNSQPFEKLGLLRWEDRKNHTLPQDFADMLGWKEMAEKALTAYKMIPEKET